MQSRPGRRPSARPPNYLGKKGSPCSTGRPERWAWRRPTADRPRFFSECTCIYKDKTIMPLAEHPTVRRFHESHGERSGVDGPLLLDAAWLRQLCLDCGADDAGLVEITRSALDDQRGDILRYFPPARTLLSFVCRMNRGPIRSP